MQASAPNQVHVQVKHRLSSVGTNIKNSAVAVFDSALARDVCRHKMTSAHQFSILYLCFFQTANVFLGNDEHMGWSLWIDVVECVSVLVFIDFLGGDFTTNNSAEQAVIHGASSKPSNLSFEFGRRGKTLSRSITNIHRGCDHACGTKMPAGGHGASSIVLLVGGFA